jgi:predicted thioesterase
MKDLFKPGDQKIHTFSVVEKDTATFQGEQVHPVCSTFALAREIEWSTRLFVLDMKDEHEEGIGTQLSIHHCSPAFVGERVSVMAVIKSLVKNELICTYEVKVGDRLVAYGETGQKILGREKLNELMNNGEKGDQ